jgi:Kef-type K+ transport system membrane component KefB
MKVPPSALLRQVIFLMLAIGLLFMLPEARRFRTRLGMLGAMMVFVLVAGCSGGGGGGSKSSTLTITPSSGGVTKTAITVNVTITQ